MRHLLLALPLLAAATSCAEPCTSPALSVSWRFDLADGTTGATCYAAGVATVDLFIDGAEAGAGVSCEQGTVTVPGLAAGAHDVVVQGRSSDGVLHYQQWGQATVEACGETRFALDPGAGWVQIAYATPGNLCQDPEDPIGTPGYVWYLLQDDLGRVAALVNGSHGPAAIPCQATPDQAVVNVQLPYGHYGLRWIQIVKDPLTAPVAVYAHCVTSDVTLRAPGVTALPVALTTATAAPCNP